jgi:feruloyl esterase
MFPGVYHCGGGEGPSIFNLLSPLIAWTETGSSPVAVIASKTSESEQGGGPSGGQLQGPSSTSSTTSSTPTVEFTRPVYPYPQQARYSGSGSVKEASSYVPYVPPATNDHYSWGGMFLSHL